jgi:hypothetical protein
MDGGRDLLHSELLEAREVVSDDSSIDLSALFRMGQASGFASH